MAARVLFWILLLIGCLQLIKPEDNDEVFCDEAGEFWKAGNVYKYRYKSVSEGLAVGTTDRTTGVKVTCTVDVHAAGQCQYILKVSECKLLETEAPGIEKKMILNPHNEEFSSQMSRHSLAFTMTKGKVTALYVSAEEPTHVTNIKRGILSTLQGNRRTEASKEWEMRTDIHGTCPTYYEAQGDHLKLSAIIKDCHHPQRYDWQLSPWSLFWNMTFIQHWWMNSTFECDYTLSNTLQRSVCYERHAILLESSQQTSNAVQTVIRQTLELKSTDSDNSNFHENIKDKEIGSIEFVWEPTPDPIEVPENFLEKGKKLMDDLVSTSQLEIRTFSPTLFEQLISLLRTSSTVLDLTQILWKCRNPNGCSDLEMHLTRSYLQDALVQCNSVPCMKALGWLAKENHMSSHYFNLMMFTWTNLRITKPEMINEIWNICKIKPSRTCLLSLTSLIHTYTLKRNQGHAGPSVKNTVDLLLSMLGRKCDGDLIKEDLPKHKITERMILALKAIGNLGSIAENETSSVSDVLYYCLRNENNPEDVTLAAIQAFRRMASTRDTYDELLKVFTNIRNPMDHRIAAYLVLCNLFPEPQLFKDVGKVLLHDESRQLHSFITSHVEDVLLSDDPSLNALKHSIKINTRTYRSLMNFEGKRRILASNHRHLSQYFDFPYIRQELSRLGFVFTEQTVFENSGFIPKQLMHNMTTTFFSQVFNLFNVDVNIEGFEPILESIFGPMSHLHKAHSVADIRDYIQYYIHKYIIKESPEGYPEWINHFEDEIEDRLKSLHEMLAPNYAPKQPALSVGLKLFGDDVAFTSLDLIKDSISEAIGQMKASPLYTYNITRVVRFIEGHFQIPTVSGFPLYWSTNATLAASPRLGIEPRFGSPFTARFYVQPSATITFVNRMLLDVPHFTRLGIQANTTVYRSLQLEGLVQYQDGGGVTLTFDVPTRPQEIASLYRVNQIIRGDKIEEIPDYDVDRVETQSCAADGYSGLQMCSYKSYADVTKGNKRWMLMAANAEFRHWVEREDLGLKYYKIHFEAQSRDPEVAYKIYFEAPGEIWRREIQGQIIYNSKDGDLSFRFGVPQKPHLHLDYKKEPIIDEGEHIGSKTTLSSQIDSSGPFLVVSYMNRVESSLRKDIRRNKNRPSKVGTHYVTIHHDILNLRYRDHYFSWTGKEQAYGSMVDTENEFVYHSTDKSLAHGLIPYTFWETEERAWFKITSESEEVDEATGTKSSHVSIILPKSLLEVEWNSQDDEESKKAYGLHISKKSLPSYELQSFLNFTYDKWDKPSRDFKKTIRIAKLKFPGVSLQFEQYRDVNDASNNNTLVLRGDMGPNTAHEELRSWNVTCRMNFHDETIAEYGIIPEMEPHKQHLDFLLIYPYRDNYENFTLLAKVRTEAGRRRDQFNFHKDLTFQSSYWQFILTGTTDLTTGVDLKILDHNSKIVHLPTSEEATYKLYARNRGLSVDIEQRIRSFIFNMDMELGSSATSNADGSMTLTITSKANTRCPAWDGLNMDLQNSFLYHPDNSEGKSIFKHKLLDYEDNVSFKIPISRHYHRRINLKSKHNTIPNMMISVDGVEDMRIFFPDSKWNLYLHVDYSVYSVSGLMFRLYHSETDSKMNKTIGFIRCSSLTSSKFLIEYKVDEKENNELQKAFWSHVDKLWTEWSFFMSDPTNDMNRMLKPYLKTDTLEEYLIYVISGTWDLFCQAWKLMNELLYCCYAFIECIWELIFNICFSFLMMFAHQEQITKLFVLWNYLELPEILNDFMEQSEKAAANYTNSNSKALIVDLRYPFQNRELELIGNDEIAKAMKTYYEFIKEITTRKVAVIYGPNYVRTFDGAEYVFPGYSQPSCIFLLAHDFAHRRFSLLSQEKAIHLLFPEIAITIDDQHKVSINRDKTHRDLPLSSWNNHVIVKRTSVNSIQIKTKYGIEIVCYKNDESCFIYSDIWNYNKLLGILGNNDNEKDNDFQTLDGRVVADVSDFVSPYALKETKACTDFNRRADNSSPKECNYDYDVLQKCNKYFFASNSPLSQCFTEVSPSEFKLNCWKDLSCEGRGICSTIQTYIRLCKNYHINIELPAECVTCGREEQSWIQQNQKKLEVVLLIEENATHLKNGTSIKGLESLLDNIENSFKKEHYRSIRYGLLSYGDDGKSIHTVQSKLLSSHRGMINVGLKNLEFKSEKELCALSSLKMVAKSYPFTEESSRVIILIVPEDKQRQYVLCADHLHDAYTALEKNGITLYVISHYKEIPIKKKVFGIRGDGYIFPQPKTGDSYLDYPKGIYAKLAAGTKGAVFHQSFLENVDTPRFFSEIGAEILAKVGKEAKMCKKCKCLNNDNDGGRSQCSVKECQ